VPLTFPKSIRFQHSSEFLRVKTAGRAYSGRLMTVGVLKECDATRIGLITSKRVGGAVERNRVRRRLRELMRLSLPQWTANVWVVAIARHTAVKASFAEMQNEWLRLAVRAGILSKETLEPMKHSADEGGRRG